MVANSAARGGAISLEASAHLQLDVLEVLHSCATAHTTSSFGSQTRGAAFDFGAQARGDEHRLPFRGVRLVTDGCDSADEVSASFGNLSLPLCADAVRQ